MSVRMLYAVLALAATPGLFAQNAVQAGRLIVEPPTSSPGSATGKSRSRRMRRRRASPRRRKSPTLAYFLGFGFVGRGFRPAAVLLRGEYRAACSPEGLPHKELRKFSPLPSLDFPPRANIFQRPPVVTQRRAGLRPRKVHMRLARPRGQSSIEVLQGVLVIVQ